MNPVAVASEFEAVYGSAPDVMVRSPGRVNLIGDHTDYNDGFVMPFAIDRHIVIGARARSDRRGRGPVPRCGGGEWPSTYRDSTGAGMGGVST